MSLADIHNPTSTKEKIEDFDWKSMDLSSQMQIVKEPNQSHQPPRELSFLDLPFFYLGTCGKVIFIDWCVIPSMAFTFRVSQQKRSLALWQALLSFHQAQSLLDEGFQFLRSSWHGVGFIRGRYTWTFPVNRKLQLGTFTRRLCFCRLSNKRISISCLIWRKNEPNNNGGIELCLEINQDGYFGGTSSLTILRVFNISHIDSFANILFLDQIDIESI